MFPPGGLVWGWRGSSRVVSKVWQGLRCFSRCLGCPELEPRGSACGPPPPLGPRPAVMGPSPQPFTQQLRKLRPESRGVAETTQNVCAGLPDNYVQCSAQASGFQEEPGDPPPPQPPSACPAPQVELIRTPAPSQTPTRGCIYLPSSEMSASPGSGHPLGAPCPLLPPEAQMGDPAPPGRGSGPACLPGLPWPAPAGEI